MSDEINKFTHAYVCYTRTKERDIVEITNIRKFKLQTYNPTKKYKILWASNGKEYDGTVVFLGESFDEVSQRAEEERVPPDSVLISNSSESDEKCNRKFYKNVETSESLG